MASEAYGGGAAAAPEGSAPAKDSRNSLYSFDEQKLELLRKTKPWMQDPKYFKKVKISPSAAMKMVSDGCTNHLRSRFLQRHRDTSFERRDFLVACNKEEIY